MKILVVILLFSFVVGCSHYTVRDDIEIHSRAGIVEAIGCESEGIHDDHLTERQSCDDQRVVIEASKIKMKLGLDFGVEYLITPKSNISCLEETRVLEHPPMTQPDGKVTTFYSRSYRVGNCSNPDDDTMTFGRDVFSWNIAEDWEAVTGVWVFKILLDNELVSRTEFTLY
jgi:hypothetical protein